MICASFNFEFDMTAVGLAVVGGLVSLAMTLLSKKWSIAVFGTSAAWAGCALFAVATGSGDMTELMMIPVAAVAAVAGAVCGGFGYLVVRSRRE